MIMNVLEFFMGCMYPGSIRTDSIESVDQDLPDCRFQVSNIDERGEIVSQGELQLTDRDLIYFIPSKFPIRWSIDCIRRYGCTDNGQIFTFETGRMSPTGAAIYAFRLPQGMELVNKLIEKIETSSHEKTSHNDQGRVKGTRSVRLGRTNFYSSNPNQDNKNPSEIETKGIKQKLNSNQDRGDEGRVLSDMSTYTDVQTVKIDSSTTRAKITDIDLKPLPYSDIDLNVTKSLNELAQAHAARRIK